MSKKTHQKQLERARAKRAAERAQQRSGRNRLIAVLLVVLLAFSVLVAVLVSSGDEPTATPTDTPTAPSTGGDPQELASGSFAEPCDLDGVTAPTSTATPYEEPPSVEMNDNVVYRVTINTTCGQVVALLDPTVSPTTVSSFLALAEDGYYDGAPFHRVIEGFMIQGGDPTGTGTGEGIFPGYTIAEETEKAQELFDLFGGYPRGALAMAKTSAPNSTGSQFFIVQGQVPGFTPATLDPQYTVFGWTVEGLDVVDRIAAGPYRSDNPQLAADPVVITSIEVTEIDRPDGGIYPTSVDDPDGPAVDGSDAEAGSPTPSPAAS